MDTSEIITLVLAIWGAVTGTASSAYAGYVSWRDRGALRVTCTFGDLMHGADLA